MTACLICNVIFCLLFFPVLFFSISNLLIRCEFFFLGYFCNAINKCKMYVFCSPFYVHTNLFYFYSCFVHSLVWHHYLQQLWVSNYTPSWCWMYVWLLSWNDFGVLLWLIHLCKNINLFFAIAFFIFCCCNDKVSIYNSLR